MTRLLFILAGALMLAAGCGDTAPPDSGEPETTVRNTANDDPATPEPESEPDTAGPELLIPRARLDIYRTVPLEADLSHLDDDAHAALGLMIEAADIMDNLFWQQAFGDPAELLDAIDDPAVRRFADINYGPWDRLDGNKPFLAGFEDKPAGARFYPRDMTKDEFEAWDHPDKSGNYSLVRRDSHGNLEIAPYHEVWSDELAEAAGLLRQAADRVASENFAEYLRLRADALISGDYQPSDMAWMDVKDNALELVIGPIETYEDRLFGYRAAFEAFVLIKDREWSRRLDKYAGMLPQLQRGLPVPDAYKAEEPGRDADLNAYDAIYYAGDANAGAKTIAINLPNDEQVQLEKGTRRLQLKNAMRAKFDEILLPISGILIAEDQRQHITFDAFFANTMFHEVAHGLGIKYTVDGESTVREALRDYASAIEEGKADILGLYMIQQLHEMGEIEGELMDYYVTFMAGIFRSIRFGAASAHGQANLIRFNYFRQAGAFSRTDSGTFRVNVPAFEQAVSNLSRDILMLQGNGDHAATGELMDMFGIMSDQLKSDLERVNAAGIPVDIIFEQGPTVTGLREAGESDA